MMLHRAKTLSVSSMRLAVYGPKAEIKPYVGIERMYDEVDAWGKPFVEFSRQNPYATDI